LHPAAALTSTACVVFHVRRTRFVKNAEFLGALSAVFILFEYRKHVAASFGDFRQRNCPGSIEVMIFDEMSARNVLAQRHQRQKSSTNFEYDKFVHFISDFATRGRSEL
jgi:hypothetical protein